MVSDILSTQHVYGDFVNLEDQSAQSLGDPMLIGVRIRVCIHRGGCMNVHEHRCLYYVLKKKTEEANTMQDKLSLLHINMIVMPLHINMIVIPSKHNPTLFHLHLSIFYPLLLTSIQQDSDSNVKKGL
jgi:hypothetical protein